MIETKIKALDFFAPLVKEGTTGLVARPGMGQLVILAELMHRFKDSYYTTILLFPQNRRDELETDGITGFAKYLTESIQEIFSKLSEISGDILLITDKSYDVSGQLLDLQEKMITEGIKNVTTILLDLSGEVVDEDIPFGT